MIIVTCIPPAGYDSYRCGWREEERDGKKVRVGMCWSAGTTELADDALTPEQIAMLQRDPGKRITVRILKGVEPTKSHEREKKGPDKEEARMKDAPEGGKES